MKALFVCWNAMKDIFALSCFKYKKGRSKKIGIAPENNSNFRDRKNFDHPSITTNEYFSYGAMKDNASSPNISLSQYNTSISDLAVTHSRYLESSLSHSKKLAKSLIEDRSVPFQLNISSRSDLNVRFTIIDNIYDRSVLHNLSDDSDWVSVSDNHLDNEKDDQISENPFRRLSVETENATYKGRELSFQLMDDGNIRLNGFEKDITRNGLRPCEEDNCHNTNVSKRFAVMHKLGRGASGVVYKAIDLCNSKLVAIKILSLADRRNRKILVQELSNFQNILNTKSLQIEKSYLNGAEHIVQFVDAFSLMNDQTVGICYEYMDGGSLQDMIDRGGTFEESVRMNTSRPELKQLISINFYILYTLDAR